MRNGVAALLLLLPLLGACSAPGTTDATSTTPTAGSTAVLPGSGATAAVSAPADPTDAPTTPPIGEKLTVDQAADFPDGLSVQIDGLTAATAPAGVTGAEGTGGEVVAADVVITNRTAAPYDAGGLVIHGYYRDAVGAVMLSDAGGTFGVGFAGPVPAGAQRKVHVGFAVPRTDAGNVTINVDPRDGTHNAVQFQGSAVGN